MIRVAPHILIILLMLCSFIQQADARNLVVDLASDHVDITTGFDGSDVTLFGQTGDVVGEVAIVIQGPKKQAVVRKKQSVFGAWINTEYMRFRDVPLFYDYASNVRGKENRALMKKTQIGLAGLNFTADYSDGDVEYLENFREALIRNKQEQNLFPTRAKNVEFLDEGFFRADFTIPPNVPTGNYSVISYVLKDGEIIQQSETMLKVAQVGLNAEMNEFAYAHAFIYGLISVLIALFFGWGINAIGRKR